MNWREVVLWVVGYCFLLPFGSWVVSWVIFRLLFLNRPWRPRTQKEARNSQLSTSRAVRENPRRALAVVRFFGVRPEIDLTALTESYEESSRSYAKLASQMSFHLLVVTSALFGISLAVFFNAGEVRSPWKDGAIAFGLFSSSVIYLHGAVAKFVKFRAEEIYLRAFMQSVRCLSLCGSLVRGDSTPLVLDQHVSLLSRQLGTFSVVGYSGMSEQRKGELRKHVQEVQQALHLAATKILREGPAGCGELVSLLSVLMHRLREQRWQALLDDGQLVTNDSPLQHAVIDKERGDSWIVLVGAIIAAAFVGLATTLGVPAAATVPAALIFLLGPAALWGSKKLGVTPRYLLNATRDGVAPPNQMQLVQSPPSGSGGGSGSSSAA